MNILQEVKNEMTYKRYSENTIRTYQFCLRQFLEHFQGVNPEAVDKAEIKRYLQQLVGKGYSKSTQNQHINAIKFYYEKILGRDRTVYYLERPIKDAPLPEVLSKNEVKRIIDRITNLKHKSMITLLYAGGLRIGELIRLRIEDINSERMVIRIRRSKGNKDRQVPLRENVLMALV